MEYLYGIGFFALFVLWLSHQKHLDELAYWQYEDNLLDIDEEDNEMI